MNKQLMQFLTNKHTAKDPRECDHSKDYWCSKCINKGIYHDLRKQGLGHGFVFSNFKD